MMNRFQTLLSIATCGVAASITNTAMLMEYFLGRAVQVDNIKTRVECAYGVCNQRLKL
jgi:hypothetical protein